MKGQAVWASLSGTCFFCNERSMWWKKKKKKNNASWKCKRLSVRRHRTSAGKDSVLCVKCVINILC